MYPRSILILLLLAVVSLAPLLAQQTVTQPGTSQASAAQTGPEPPTGEAPVAETVPGLFPLNLLLDALESGGSPWQPDWPLVMPPDGFTLSGGYALSLTITLPAEDPGTEAAVTEAPTAGAGTGNTAAAKAAATGASDTSAEAAGTSAPSQYRFARNPGGRILAFPFFINGNFYQAEIVYDQAGLINTITLDNPANPDPWEFEFLQYEQGEGALARINHSGTWYFAALEYLDKRANETWYDPEGQALAFFSLEYREKALLAQQNPPEKRLISLDSRDEQGQGIWVYNYDSFDRVSALDTPDGSYSALYAASERFAAKARSSFPRYWERPESNYTLQWDERGLLVRLTEHAKPGSPPPVLPESASAGDIRYEYTLDSRGNWTERREISLIRRFGRLVPGSEGVITRAINYGDE
ncbi:hypothetical protein TREPR_1663 [Treponema primitia ZAS-2]|uniref:YD repeat protein n=1 Tax=Treponema primitia (strain ATCC BAA-887 / DSM 12427 / ZAS-2) TaxID=545694 RepID=F5YNN1_TREPZ|nr:hypothetical protein [Treponema primitia]AEF86224.1 hypothetical protein TREPR_1663 [Treponema primitia ZAS-2]